MRCLPSSSSPSSSTIAAPNQLSGGQKKRTSTALELLTKPSLLFLDEPTSGLDPDLDSEVMLKLRDLADDGRTVVVVTHSTLNLHVCDLLLVLAEGGQLAYLGKPEDALDLLRRPLVLGDVPHPQEPAAAGVGGALPGDRRNTSGTWSAAPSGPVAKRRTDLPPLRQQTIRRQFSTLCRRYLSVIAADRGLPRHPHRAAGPAGRDQPHRSGPVRASGWAGSTANLKARQLLLVIVLGATLMGAASSVREIVKERPIYQRERSIGLSAGAYLWSKVVVLSAVVTLPGPRADGAGTRRPQGGARTRSCSARRCWRSRVAVVVLTIVSAMLGLVISAWVSNADKAMPMLVLMIMIQLVFSGGLVPLGGRAGLEQVSYVVPARWGFAMAASTVDLHDLEIFRPPGMCAQSSTSCRPPGALPDELRHRQR